MKGNEKLYFQVIEAKKRLNLTNGSKNVEDLKKICEGEKKLKGNFIKIQKKKNLNRIEKKCDFERNKSNKL